MNKPLADAIERVYSGIDTHASDRFRADLLLLLAAARVQAIQTDNSPAAAMKRIAARRLDDEADIRIIVGDVSRASPINALPEGEQG